LWIFRDGKKTVSTRKLIAELNRAIRAASGGNREAVVDALIRAGELESALADSEAPAAPTIALVTNRLSHALLRSRLALCGADHLLADLLRQEIPLEVTISPPEGFAFYALSPGDFAFGLSPFPALGRHVGVIGIRSIGTTLSALAKAALERSGAHVQRITVRPTGHPFDRVTHFNTQQRKWVQTLRQREAVFLVVDEGPGMSGSSFLSVAEALEREGIPADQIHLAGSRDPNLNSLRARDATQRWTRYRWQRVTSQVHEKYRGHVYFGADVWRSRHFSESEWPSCWTQMERLKFLSADGNVLYKFDGLGRFGREVRERVQRLAELGFGCRVANAGDGMTAYNYVDGRPLQTGDLTPEMVGRIAEYCAHRGEFVAAASVHQQLPEMVEFNLAQEFGMTAPLDLESLVCDRPVIADGKMHPHEWMRTPDGRILKLDAASHGDDHFFPGPTDVAWDLAGAIVEWRMGADAANLMLQTYRKLSGCDPSARLPAYLLAYSVFRMGYCKMAAEAEGESAETVRLEKSYRWYRATVEGQLAGAAVRQLRAA
jgi:hypothetical protein